MNITGIICEYNPFHNGHLYHLKETRRITKDSIIIVVLGGNFLQRGNMSIINKIDKTRIALEYGADIVVELPFAFATQSADLFAKGAIAILKELKCNTLVFGSESNNTDELVKLANIQLNNKEYDTLIKKHLDTGINYPTALNNALKALNGKEINTPNDLLGLSYIKEIIKEKANIVPISIKRTNEYHDKYTTGELSSATSIRECLNNKKNIKAFVPKDTYSILKNYINHDKEYFNYLKYKILSEGISISKYQTVDEGIENRILKNINNCNNLDELIKSIKTKRYTYNKLSRMFTHILCNFTKSDAQNNKDIKYIKILGFNNKGKSYLNSIKKEIKTTLITNVNKNTSKLLAIDIKADNIYSIINNIDYRLFINKPIINNSIE